MRLHIRSINYKIRKIIEHLDLVPTDPTTNEPKNELDFNDKDEKIWSLNAKAINILFYAIDCVEYNRVSTCESAKELWTILQTTHEGTNQVNESKIL